METPEDRLESLLFSDGRHPIALHVTTSPLAAETDRDSLVEAVCDAIEFALHSEAPDCPPKCKRPQRTLAEHLGSPS